LPVTNKSAKIPTRRGYKEEYCFFKSKLTNAQNSLGCFLKIALGFINVSSSSTYFPVKFKNHFW
jgi:hypothetical protein